VKLAKSRIVGCKSPPGRTSRQVSRESCYSPGDQVPDKLLSADYCVPAVSFWRFTTPLSGVHGLLVADGVSVIFAQPCKDNCGCGGQRT
jgi:hypothetical protein